MAEFLRPAGLGELVVYPLVGCFDVDVKAPGDNSNLLPLFPDPALLALLHRFTGDARQVLVLGGQNPFGLGRDCAATLCGLCNKMCFVVCLLLGAGHGFVPPRRLRSQVKCGGSPAC